MKTLKELGEEDFTITLRKKYLLQERWDVLKRLFELAVENVKEQGELCQCKSVNTTTNS